MGQPTLPLRLPKQLIALPTEQLLTQFGSGGHAPGSGSAAALMGLLAGQLIATVCKISDTNTPETAHFQYVLGRVEGRILSELKTLFQKDAEDFDLVIKVRIQRDNTADPVVKRRLREQSLRLLEDSTDLIFSICRLCLELVDYALIVFDSGSKKVRGDSGAAISAAIAGAMSGVFIINLNLRSFQSSRWAVGRQRESENLHSDIMRKQEDAFSRIITLKPDKLDPVQPTFFD